MISAVVPVKDLSGTKSRLRLDFNGPAVERIATAMLEDVVHALCRVSALDRVVVVTPDERVALVARNAGAEALLRDDPGLNACVDAASGECSERPNDGALVVLGDVPGVHPGEIETLLRTLSGSGVALAPSRDGGTSALLRVPWNIIAAGFGPESASVHRDRAQRSGARFVEVPLPSLAVDVDRREDLESLMASAANAPRTRAVWEGLSASERR